MQKFLEKLQQINENLTLVKFESSSDYIALKYTIDCNDGDDENLEENYDISDIELAIESYDWLKSLVKNGFDELSPRLIVPYEEALKLGYPEGEKAEEVYDYLEEYDVDDLEEFMDNPEDEDYFDVTPYLTKSKTGTLIKDIDGPSIYGVVDGSVAHSVWITGFYVYLDGVRYDIRS